MPDFVETIDIGAPAPNYNDGSDDLDSHALPTRGRQYLISQEIWIITLIKFRFKKIISIYWSITFHFVPFLFPSDKKLSRPCRYAK